MVGAQSAQVRRAHAPQIEPAYGQIEGYRRLQASDPHPGAHVTILTNTNRRTAVMSEDLVKTTVRFGGWASRPAGGVPPWVPLQEKFTCRPGRPMGRHPAGTLEVH